MLKSGGKIITSGKQHGTLNHWNTMLNLASKTAKGLASLGFEMANKTFFDTITVKTMDVASIRKIADRC